MNTLLQNTLRAIIERAIQQLLKADWSKMEQLILYYMDADIPGAQKREKVMSDLRRMGSNWATFILGAGVDILYGQITKKSLTRERS